MYFSAIQRVETKRNVLALCLFLFFKKLRWNSHNIKLTIFKVHNSVPFSMFPVLGNHHHYLVPNIFISLAQRKTLHLLLNRRGPYFPFPKPPDSHRRPYFLSLWICLFWIFRVTEPYSILPSCVWVIR